MISVLNAIASVKSLNYEHLFVDLIYRLVDKQKKRYEIRQQNSFK